MKIGYIYLIITIIFDSVGIAFLNKANGFDSPKYLFLGLLLLNLGLVSLSFTLKTVDMTIANTTFAGVSSALVAIIGYAYFGERFTVFQYLCIASILFGLVGLNYSGISK
jgi:small multidrug resistance pump